MSTRRRTQATAAGRRRLPCVYYGCAKRSKPIYQNVVELGNDCRDGLGHRLSVQPRASCWPPQRQVLAPLLMSQRGRPCLARARGWTLDNLASITINWDDELTTHGVLGGLCLTLVAGRSGAWAPSPAACSPGTRLCPTPTETHRKRHWSCTRTCCSGAMSASATILSVCLCTTSKS